MLNPANANLEGGLLLLVRRRILLGLSVLVPAAVAVACDNLGDPYTSEAAVAANNNVDASAPSSSSSAEPLVPNEEDDAILGEPEGPINPGAGRGAYALRGVKQSDGGFSVTPLHVDPQKNENGAIGCPQTVQKSSLDLMGLGMRAFYEPKAPDQAKVVYPIVVKGIENDLVMVRNDSTCDPANGPRILSSGVTGSKLSPSFSDDGKRVAFVATTGLNGDRIVTAATEGPTDIFEIRNVAGKDFTIAPASPVWIRDAEGTKVAWVEVDKTTKNQYVRVALDRAVVGGTPKNLLNCGAVFHDIVQIGLFRGAGGKIYVAFTAQLNDPDAGQPSSRGIFAVDYKLSCGSRTLLFDDRPASASFSSDFAIARDGERMAHVSNRTIGGSSGVDKQKRIWIGSVSTRTRKVCSTPPADSSDLAPQWLADGAQLVWTRRASSGDRATLMIADVKGDDCTNERALIPSSDSEIAFTAKNACAFGGGGVPGSSRLNVSMSAFVVMSLMLLARRKKQAVREGGL